MVEFLKTGNLGVFTENENMEMAARLGLRIDAIADATAQTKVAEAFLTVQRQRDFISIEEDKSRYRMDWVYLFEDDHYARAVELIDREEYEATAVMLKSLSLLYTMVNYSESEYHPENPDHSVTTHYAELLIKAEPEELTEIYEQIWFFATAQDLFLTSTGNIFFNAFHEDGLNVFDAIKNAGFTHSRDLIMGIMGMWYKNKNVRDYLKEYLKYYSQIISEHREDSSQKLEAVFSDLDDLTDEMGRTLPVLPVIHHMSALQAFRQFQPELAQSRMEKVLEAYKEVEELNLAEATGWTPLKEKRDSVKDWDVELLKMKEYFSKKGYTRLADYYQSRAER
jgi:hypothetical protein